jgi:hypothetical protein
VTTIREQIRRHALRIYSGFIPLFGIVGTFFAMPRLYPAWRAY